MPFGIVGIEKDTFQSKPFTTRGSPSLTVLLSMSQVNGCCFDDPRVQQILKDKIAHSTPLSSAMDTGSLFASAVCTGIGVNAEDICITGCATKAS